MNFCLYQNVSGKELTGSGATKMWYDEIKDYDFNQPAKYNSKCGHFTQVIWAASKELGGGIAKTKDGKYFVVARYSPAGNLLSAFKDNIKAPLSGQQDINEIEPAPKKLKNTESSGGTAHLNQDLSSRDTIADDINYEKNNKNTNLQGIKVDLRPKNVENGFSNEGFEMDSNMNINGKKLIRRNMLNCVVLHS